MENKKIYEKIKKIVNGNDNDYIETLREIMLDLEREIVTNGKVNKGIVSIFKNIQKDMGYRGGTFQQINETIDNTYMVCNGYALIDYKTYNDIPLSLQNFVNCKITDYEKLNLCYSRLKNSNEGLEKYNVNIEDLEKLTRYNKLHKNEKIAYYFVNNKAFNPELILDFYKLADRKEKSFYVETDKQLYSPLNFELKNANGIVLPVKLNAEIEDEIEKTKRIIEGE